MKRGWRADCSLVLVGMAAGLLLAGIQRMWKSKAPQAPAQRVAEVLDYVDQHFVLGADPQELTDRGLRGLVSSLDAHSRYYTADEVQRVERETSGHFEGIGIVLLNPVDLGQILYCLPDSPAQLAGLRAGDQIIELDGEVVSQLPSGGLVERLSNEAQKQMHMRVQSLDDQSLDVTVTRAVLTDPSVRHTQILADHPGVGYLSLSSFSEATPLEFDRALTELEHAGLEALIIDLRGNLGGLVTAAVQIANRFIEQGTIVSTRGRGSNTFFDAKPEQATHVGLPLVLLVDNQSASSSEILAAALKDHRAAVLVGSPTFGKGTVQRVHEVNSGRELLKLTTSYYFTPSGHNLEAPAPETTEEQNETVDEWKRGGVTPHYWVSLNAKQTRSIQGYLARQPLNAETRAQLEQWQADSGRQLIPDSVEDPQLEVAVALLQP